MAKNKPETTQSQTAEAPETKFTIRKLREYSLRLFGVPTSTFDGATAELGEDETYTVKEVKEIIGKWKKQKITVEKKEEN